MDPRANWCPIALGTDEGHMLASERDSQDCQRSLAALAKFRCQIDDQEMMSPKEVASLLYRAKP